MENYKNREEFWKNIEDSYIETNTSFGTEQRVFIGNLVKNNNISSVLELGCNSGGNLLYISKISPETKICGIDICQNAIEYGKTIENNLAEFIVGSLYDLSQFKDKSFDLVFTRGVLLHISHEKVGYIIENMLRIANKFVFNMEFNEKNNRVMRHSGNIPHAFSHNFKSLYSSLGKNANIQTMEKITGKYGKGGARDFVWCNLSKEQLVLK